MEVNTSHIRSYSTADLGSAFQLLTTNGWSHRIPDRQFLERLVSASQRVVVAVSQDQVVGFARAITDGLSNGYLSMVVVAAEWRGKRQRFSRNLDLRHLAMRWSGPGNA